MILSKLKLIFTIVWNFLFLQIIDVFKSAIKMKKMFSGFLADFSSREENIVMLKPFEIYPS